MATDLSRNSIYSATLAAELVNLATLANQSLDNLFPPSGWQLLYSFASGSGHGQCQYYLATKTLNNQAVCAVVVGAPWSPFISFYYPPVNHVFTTLSSDIAGSDSSGAQIDTGFSRMYGAIRTSLLDDIQKAKQSVLGFKDAMPVICAGIGPGAPIAQLASLDLRPGNGTSPATAMQAYVYSCPAYGDLAYQTLYTGTVPDSYRVQAQADLFPTKPDSSSGYVQVGNEHDLSLKIPTYDSPWVERDGPYYYQLLTTGNPVDSAGSGTTDGGSGFSQVLAFSLSQLCAVAYQEFQHPGSTIPFQITPYVLKQSLTLGSDIWVSLFESPSSVVLAFRGTVSWAELLEVVCDGSVGFPSWLDRSFGQYSKPIIDLYAQGRDALRQAVEGLGNKPVIVTGHGSGGALANLVAVDLKQNPLSGDRPVSDIYTFGAIPAASNVFARNFNTDFANLNYQVVRPQDVMPSLSTLGFFVPQGTQVTLSGGTFNPYNGTTFHGLLTYVDLLSPQSSQGSDALAADSDTDSPSDYFLRLLDYNNIEPSELKDAVLSPPKGDSQVTLNWYPERSQVQPLRVVRNHICQYAYQRIELDEGQELVIEGPAQERIQIHAAEIVLGKGAKIVVRSPVEIVADRLIASDTEPSYLTFTAADGEDGASGFQGVVGVPGLEPNGIGGTGGSGGPGASGANGSAFSYGTVYLNEVSGKLIVSLEGGNGGAGGVGGAGGTGGRGGNGPNNSLGPGGSGGSGGHGGNGGHGGDGPTVQVYYTSLAPGGELVDGTTPRVGGAGGAGGKGGLPGLGHPDGQMGRAGSQGQAGHGGLPATVSFIKS